MNVLIVDDQGPFRAAARRLVALVAGWQVVAEAVSGEEALAMVARSAPSLILMDINLPGISGIEATRRILATHPHIPIILVSTYAAEDLPPDAHTCGATGYIRKEHLTPSRLRALVHP
ncbi:response regulator [Acrocarpospora catenulata]|uniref:response regulator n=1 Tax=Acrocarpospora catenulata TaxID=2836182 RepID=UPI001BD9AA3E|nr:response regulator transcription factor [Acrocarpospora catenulata]